MFLAPGTFLTLNHAHTALFGAFGLLGIGLIYFCLRTLAADQFVFKERLGLTVFWFYNAGMVLWIVLNFFPSFPRFVSLRRNTTLATSSLLAY